MKALTVLDFQKRKLNKKEKISMITCYDYTYAKIIAETAIDCILVGDSCAMVMQGHKTSLPATVEMVELYLRGVVRGAAKNKFIIADMPFLSYRKSLKQTMDVVHRYVTAGACAVKLEGVEGNEAAIRHIVESGIPVMGHIGLTVQKYHTMGGFRVQGKEETEANKILEQAKQLEAAGCFAIVLECVPEQLAETITQTLSIPTIGIGSGAATDGQVLVLQDLLGLDTTFSPKFAKKYTEGFEVAKNAIDQFDKEVKEVVFPSKEYIYC